jgi:hypothetical protein
MKESEINTGSRPCCPVVQGARKSDDEHNNQVVLDRTVFNYQRRDGAISLEINELKIRESSSFSEIWGFGYHPTRLTERRLSRR